MYVSLLYLYIYINIYAATYHIYYIQKYMDFGPHLLPTGGPEWWKVSLGTDGPLVLQKSIGFSWRFYDKDPHPHGSFFSLLPNKSWDSSSSLQFLSSWLATFEFIGGLLQLWPWFGSSLEVLSCMHQWCTTTGWFTSHVLIDLKHVNCSSKVS